MTAEEIARQHRKALGFVHTKAARERGELFIMGDYSTHGAAGFVDYHLRRDRQLTIYAIAVAEEHRGTGWARWAIEYMARQSQPTSIVARCPVDNASNGFWLHMGFQLVETKPASGSKRAINKWVLMLKGEGQ